MYINPQYCSMLSDCMQIVKVCVMAYMQVPISEEALVHNIVILWNERISAIFSNVVREARKQTAQHSGLSEEKLAEKFKVYVLKQNKTVSQKTAKILAREAATNLYLDYEGIDPKYSAVCYEAAERAVESWWRGYFASDPDDSDDLFLEAGFHVIMFVSAAAFKFASDLAEKNQT